ncbi:divergent polysaccharide deacetylase family protein [Methylobacterium sp. E-045]|uniref:divergent polysaccharide deacetylase family protein n=1 Tax=Methylobacterium sp. E-045 TaxID=2836575 RepID=UPI001FB90FF8|nr:divergent polysaccharide deacetylase family protein [Methylobacterium sp. E-045]MCJ2130935.1 divergent polysaccharide deacetylase family protein [Methylobacterium sp. E-045]
MTVATDDILTRPLGTVSAAAPRSLGQRLRGVAMPRMSAAAVVAVAVASLAVGGTILAMTGDPRGGEPSAIATITLREPAAPPPVAKAPEPPASAPRSAGEVETASGVHVVRPAGTAAPTDAVIIRVPNAEPARLAAPDPRLMERGRHGSLPKIGDDRRRPLDVYARADSATGAPGARIALLVTGLGVGQAATAGAIARLPPAISLAFSPYGGDLERSVARARDFGHEILVQAPMEPFDYPDSDPGPQTMLTGSRAPENLDRLSWVMSRFGGYVGLVNFMGAKLEGDAAAFEPVLREIGARGLGFVDDGTSSRSLATSLGGKLKVPVARAEIVLDAMPQAEAIDRELARLEAQAKANGFALASAGAMPMTIERIARWSRDLEARGVRLVPVSTALRGTPPARLSSAGP